MAFAAGKFARKFAQNAFLLVVLAPLGACALADVAQGPAPSLYVLTAPKAEAVPGGPAAKAQLVVEEFTAPGAINTGRIVFRPSPNEIKYYAGARWGDRAPSMIAALLVEALADTGRFPAVIGPGSQARTDLALVGDIRDFAAYRPEDAGLGASSTHVRVSLFVRLVRARDRTIVASKVFSADAPVGGSGMGKIVDAYDTALDQVLGEITVWTIDNSLEAMVATR